MPVSKSAVRNFLNRDLKDYGKVKKLSKKRVDEEIAKIEPKVEFYTEPMDHQKRLFLCMWHEPRFLNSLDMGGGKSMVALEVLHHRKKAGLPHKALVVVPRLVHFSSWRQQIEKHRPELSHLILDADSTDQRWQQLYDYGEDADLIITTYPSLVALCSDLEQQKKGKKKGKKKRVIKKSKLHNLSQYVDGVVFDEIQKIGYHTTASHKACHAIANVSEFAYGLSGTLVSNHVEKTHACFLAIDNGETLGRTLGMFRAAFCRQTTNKAGYPEWKFQKSMSDTLAKMMRNRSLRFADEELNDLPPKNYQRIYVPLPPEAQSYYEDIVNELRNEAGKNYEAVKNSFIRLRQLSSGYLTLKEEGAEDSDKVTLDFPTKPKLDGLVSLLLDVPFSSKAVVFFEFTHSGKCISQALQKEGLDHELIYGGMTKKPQDAIERFQNDPNCRFLVGNSAMIAEGVNLQCANFTFYYESSVRSDIRLQSEKRTCRTGQTKKCYYYDLISEGSHDERILDIVSEGEDLMRRLLDDPNYVLGDK